MRKVLLAQLAAAGPAMGLLSPAQAVGTRYPFCLQGNDSPALSNCTFTSYEQCQATASGRHLYCIANPYYAGGGDAGAIASAGRLQAIPTPATKGQTERR